jgi:hypothetical protein
VRQSQLKKFFSPPPPKAKALPALIHGHIDYKELMEPKKQINF